MQFSNAKTLLIQKYTARKMTRISTPTLRSNSILPAEHTYQVQGWPKKSNLWRTRWYKNGLDWSLVDETPQVFLTHTSFGRLLPCFLEVWISSEVTMILKLCPFRNKIIASLFFGITGKSSHDVNFKRTVYILCQNGISSQFRPFLSPLKSFQGKITHKSLLLKSHHTDDLSTSWYVFFFASFGTLPFAFIRREMEI